MAKKTFGVPTLKQVMKAPKRSKRMPRLSDLKIPKRGLLDPSLRKGSKVF